MNKEQIIKILSEIQRPDYIFGFGNVDCKTKIIKPFQNKYNLKFGDILVLYFCSEKQIMEIIEYIDNY